MSFRGGKKASFWENKKRVLARGCVALVATREERRARRGEGERRVFSPRSRQNSTHEREKRKKAGKEKKKKETHLKSPHKNKFLASTTMADVQHERGYQKQVGVNVG